MDEETVLTVKIEGVVNGGVIAMVEGLRGFIPASKLSLSYIEDLESYLEENELSLGRISVPTSGGSDYLTCIRYGSNNTALILRVNNWNWINLIYTKTDSWIQRDALMDIINASSDALPDAGL